MSRRTASQPPEIPGFTYLQLLGSGGFADVFLYEQRLPRRRVAVKVLLPDRISTSAAQFTAEANVMAMLSTHPAIVSIYQAGVADDGRPYLVMEYCPRPNLQVRYRREPFSVAEALHTSIPVAAAVETAHRANVLHRDIKPANILVTEYNRPALTDFGIASTTAQPDESQGVSIPWSPPESFADPPRSDPSSDVYQLGATVYTLLAGRSPFEIPGESNGSIALIERIEQMPLPDLQRDDVPRSLRAVLEKSMAKDPAKRYRSAVALARALQKVQIELGHPVTQIDILDDHPEDEPYDEDDVDDIGETRIRRLQGNTVMPAPEQEPVAEPEPVALAAPAAPVVPPAAPVPAQPFEIPKSDAPADHSAFAPPSADDAGADDVPQIPLIDQVPPRPEAEEPAPSPQVASAPSAPAPQAEAPDATVAAPRREPQAPVTPMPSPSAPVAPEDRTIAAPRRTPQPPAAPTPAPQPADDATIAAPPRAPRPDAAPDPQEPAALDETVAAPRRDPRPAPPAASAPDETIAAPRRAPQAPPSAPQPAPDETVVAPRRDARPAAPAPDETVARPRRDPAPQTPAQAPDETIAVPRRDPRPPAPQEAPDETVARPRPPQAGPSPAPSWVLPTAAPDETVARPRRAEPAPSPIPDYSFGTGVEIDASSVPKADPSQFKVASSTSSHAAVTRQPAEAPAQKKKRWPLFAGLGAAAVVIVGAAIAIPLLLNGAGGGGGPVTTDEPDQVRDVPPVSDLQGTVSGDEVTFTWENDDAELGDSYLWGIADEGRPTDFANETGSRSLTIDLEPGDQTCIDVILKRSDGNLSEYQQACVDNP